MSQADIEQDLDNITRRISNRIPRQPYYLVPNTSDPIHVHPNQVDWEFRLGTNFSRDEHHKQYLSFLRPDPSEPNVVSKELPLEMAQPTNMLGKSGSVKTTDLAAPKKKISLADYNKNKSQSKGKPSTDPTSELKERLKAFSPAILMAKAQNQLQKPEMWTIPLNGFEQSNVNPQISDQQQLESLGKTLKHRYQTLYDAETTAHGERNLHRKTALLIGVESVLCFMLSFSKRSGEQRLWPTLYQMQDQLASRSGSFPYLHGLCHILSATCALRLQTLLSGVHYEDLGAGPGLTKHLEALNVAQNRLLGGAKRGDELLTRDLIKHDFPITHQRMCKVGLVAMQPGDAIEFAIAFLKEWAAKEGLDWKQTLDPDKFT